MKRLLILLSILILVSIVYISKSKNSNTSLDMSECQDDTLEYVKSYWDLPMDSSALDSIKYHRSIDTTDFGLPLPIDEYSMCVKRYGKPQSHITLDMILGKWYGYGHLYDPIEVITFYPDSSYTSSNIPMLGLDDNNRPIYGTNEEEYHGKYTYEESQNLITMIDVIDEKDLTRGDYLKYENPHNITLVVFSIEKDTMSLYCGTGDCRHYYRCMMSNNSR